MHWRLCVLHFWWNNIWSVVHEYRHIGTGGGFTHDIAFRHLQPGGKHRFAKAAEKRRRLLDARKCGVYGVGT
jgi:hypothetical protein